MSSKTKDPKLKLKGAVRSRYKGMLLIFLWVIVLALNGLGEYLDTGFDTSTLFTSQWFYKVFRVLLSNILIFFGTLAYLIDKIRKRRADVADKKEKVEKYVDEHEDPVTFDPFLVGFNYRRKIRYYKKLLRKKEHKLDNDASSEDIELWVRYQRCLDDDGNPTDKELAKEAKGNKYCQKKREIQIQMSDKFINDRIEFIKIKKYRPVSKAFVTEGTEPGNDFHDDYHIQKGYEKMFMDLWPKFAIMIGTLIMLESLFMEYVGAESWLVAAQGMIFKVVPLIIQAYMAGAYAETYVEEKIKGDLQKRLDIMVLYMDYILENKGGGSHGSERDEGRIRAAGEAAAEKYKPTLRGSKRDIPAPGTG